MNDELLNLAPCGFLTFADDGKILAANRTLLQMLGYEQDGPVMVEGMHIQSLFTPGSRVFYQTHFFPLLKLYGKAEEVYLSLRTRDGGDLPVLVNGVRRERDGTIVNDCVFVMMRQRNRFEDEILRAKKAAEEATLDREQAYAALAESNEALEQANVELEAQQEELEVQQEQLLTLNAELHLRAERTALLNRIGQTLRSGREPERILEDSLAELGQALAADRCFFVEYDAVRRGIRISADWHRPDLSSLRGMYRMDDFAAEVAAFSWADGVQRFTDVQASGGALSVAADNLTSLGIRSGIRAALMDEGTVVASLNIAMTDTPRVWSDEEVNLIQEVALLTRTEAEEARLREKEHRIAEQLQAALLPALPDEVPGLQFHPFYQAALSEANVGGDFYDVFPLRSDCYAIVVADLSGKGLDAAAQVATVRHMLRALLYQEGMTVSEGVTTLNDMLTQHGLLSGFATAFIGVYDVKEQTLTYVNAGQEPGLLWAAASQDIEELGPTGPVLGGFPGATFRQEIIPVSSGDVLALFTDGLTEAGLNRKDLLGMPGVVSLFRQSAGKRGTPQEIVAHVMAGVQAYATPAGMRDDVCLLIGCVP